MAKSFRAAKLLRNLFNAGTTRPLVKGPQVFRFGEKTAKERPGTHKEPSIAYWDILVPMYVGNIALLSFSAKRKF